MWFAPESTWWLPAAVVLGCLCHLAGDALTSEGVPLLWPLRPDPLVETPLWRNNGHFALPLLGSAGSKREWAFAAVVDLYIRLRRRHDGDAGRAHGHGDGLSGRGHVSGPHRPD